MMVMSLIVESDETHCEAVMSSLAAMDRVDVFGRRDSRIVTVVEGDDPGAVEDTVRRIGSIENVSGVYPVYSEFS